MAEPFIGQIMQVGFDFAPRGWALCNGQLLPISQNSALFSLLGTTYGGDGRTTYGLPDLRGRVPVHAVGGTGPGLHPVSLGQWGGTNTVTLNQNNLPAHSHGVKVRCNAGPGNANTAVGNVLSNDAGMASATYSSLSSNLADMHEDAIEESSVGGNAPVTNMQPFLGVNFVIALIGVYPSRS